MKLPSRAEWVFGLGAGAGLALALRWIVGGWGKPAAAAPLPLDLGPDGEVPAVKTPATGQQVLDALAEAWPRAFPGEEPNQGAIEILTAQSAIETGNWKSLWNWNLGNVKRVKGAPWMMLENVWEIIDGKRVVFQPPHPQTHFSAYPSLAAGAVTWLTKMRKRFDKSWAVLMTGDAKAFAYALKKQGYYTADADEYAHALESRLKSIRSSQA